MQSPDLGNGTTKEQSTALTDNAQSTSDIGGVGVDTPTTETSRSGTQHGQVSGTFTGVGTNTQLSVRMDRTATMRRVDDKHTREMRRIHSDFGTARYWTSEKHATSAIWGGGR